MHNKNDLDYVSDLTLSLANTTLISKLQKINLEGKLCYISLIDEEEYVHIFNEVGTGNPAMLLMFLYSLLGTPIELIKKKRISKTFKEKLNKFMKNNLKTFKASKEDDYIRRIRNSISHYNTSFYLDNGNSMVRFHDVNTKNSEDIIDIEMTTSDCGKLLNKLSEELKIIVNSLREEYNSLSE